MKIATLIFISLFCVLNQSYALTQDCVPDDESSNFEKLAKSISQLGWFSVEGKQVMKANCAQDRVVDTKFLENYFATISKDGKSKGNILGIQFENENELLIKHFANLVDPKLLRVPGQQASKVNQSKIPANCKKVVCAAQALFGKDQALRLLYMMDQYQINGSHLVFEHSSAWNTKELDTVLASLDDMPAILRKQLDNKPLYHFKRGYTRGSDGVVANAYMEIFDAWNDQSEGEKRYTLFHELAHNLSNVERGTELDESPEWLAFSKWEKKKDEWIAKDISHLPSQYAATNPAEDFAESLSAYRYHPNARKILGEEKYQFIKETVFLGMEFDHAKKCAKNMVMDTDQFLPNAAELSIEELEGCYASLSDSMEIFSMESFEQCYLRTLSSKLASEKLNKAELKYPNLTAKRIKGLRGKSYSFADKLKVPSLWQAKKRMNSFMADAIFKTYSSYESELKKSTEDFCTTFSSKDATMAYHFIDNFRKSEKAFKLSSQTAYRDILKRTCEHLIRNNQAFSLESIEHSLDLVFVDNASK